MSRPMPHHRLKGGELYLHLGQHRFEARPGLGVQAPGHIAGCAHEVLLALPSACPLSLIDEGMVRGTDSLEEEVMAIQELAVPLQ